MFDEHHRRLVSLAFIDDHTLYWYGWHYNCDYLVEITLP